MPVCIEPNKCLDHSEQDISLTVTQNRTFDLTCTHIFIFISVNDKRPDSLMGFGKVSDS